MQLGSATTWAEVIFAWLSSEGKNLALSDADRERLITNADLGNEANNVQRLKLLRKDLNRYVIIDRLPPDPTVRRVSIEGSDLYKLFIVPTPHWYLDTGMTFRLTGTQANLMPGRTIDLGNGRECIDNYERVTALQAILADYDFRDATECLILVADNDDGPYVIIDGTHRATALYRNCMEGKGDNLPWKGLLVTHPQMRSSQWHVESTAMTQLHAYWQMMIRQGRLT
jgi:hypothetical protein